MEDSAGQPLEALRFGVCLVAFSLLLAACGGGKRDGSSATPRQTPLGAIATPNADTPASQRSIWGDQNAQNQAITNCVVKGPRQPESQRLCIAQFMQNADAYQEAIDFFALNGSWLVAFVRGAARMDAGLIQPPGTSNVAPQFVFLNGTPRVQLESDLFHQVFPPNPTDGTVPFRTDPMFPSLFLAAQKKFQNGDDPFDLKLFDDNVLESFSSPGSDMEEFIVESGIHNFCHDCGIGVAARYAFDFNSSGKMVSIKLLGLCQGRVVTDDIAGIGRVSYHQFSGIKIKPGGGGITEPYLVTVPGLLPCPQSIQF